MMGVRSHATGWRWAVLMMIALLAGPAWAAETWLLVDTRAMTLSVMRGTKPVQVYQDIAIGRFGTTTAKRARDGRTPLGEYRIDRITDDSPFRRFFGIDYPGTEQAREAFEAGRISERDYDAIRRAHRQHRSPPQNTPLGGYLGIHGLGEGDPSVHMEFNWTNGCIALTNEQIDDLAQWITAGMRVIIR